MMASDHYKEVGQSLVSTSFVERLDLVNFFGLPRLPLKYAPVAPEICPGCPGNFPRLPRLSRKLAPVVPKTLKHDLMSQITGPMCLISCVEAITP